MPFIKKTMTMTHDDEDEEDATRAVRINYKNRSNINRSIDQSVNATVAIISKHAMPYLGRRWRVCVMISLKTACTMTWKESDRACGVHADEAAP
jgi:hypothetical protein